MTDVRPLEEATTDLGDAYRRWKTGEADKEKHRKEFFAAATAEASERTLAQKTVPVEDEDVATEEEARAWLARHYPTWRVLDFDFNDDGDYLEALIEEDPQYMERVFVNPQDRKVYTKSVSVGSPLLDDDRLREEDPDLWERITEEPPPPPRRLLPSEKISAEDLAAMEEYMYPGKPQVKLLAPRDAKDEELKEAEDADGG